METPSSTRRVTRSQTLAANSANNSSNINNIPLSRKIEDSGKGGLSKSRQRNAKQQEDRSALIDITNDSPIVGLAMESLETPSSAMTKQRSSKAKKTPGSGEALLRGQVKTLLQKVEEEAELSKLSLDNRPFLHLRGFVNSPTGLLAPTPANTPQVSNLSGDEGLSNNGLGSVTASPVVEEQMLISQAVSDIFDGKREESPESQTSLGITRSLLLDFSDKSVLETSSECPSALTVITGESECKGKSSPDDDDASIWSIQVNASTHDEDVIEEGEDTCYEDNYEEEDDVEVEEQEEDEDGGLLDELCEGISKMTVKEKTMAKFSGKHTRFMYNSDDEMVEGEESGDSVDDDASPAILRLNGLPTPKGKHLRFSAEDEEDDN